MKGSYREYKNLNLTQIAKEVRKYWEENDVFQKSLDNRKDGPAYVFYEGPPSANGTPGIHHVMTVDWPNNDEQYKMYNQLNVNSYPYYFIINRKGVIVNYGSMMRPSYPGTAECIDLWLEKEVH